MISKGLRSIIAIALFLISLTVIAFYLWSNDTLITLLGNLSWKTAIFLIIIRFLFVSINGLFLKLFAARLNVNLAWYEWIGLPFITTMGNYLMPLSGGMFVRAAYLKKQHALSYTHFITLLAANYMITFWATIFISILILPFIWDNLKYQYVLLFTFIAFLCFFTLFLLIPIFKFRSSNPRFNVLNNALIGWERVIRDLKLTLQLFSIITTSLFLNAVAFWSGYWALNITVTWPAAIIISFSTVFSTLTTLTPGNFGIREAITSLISEIVGVGIGSGLLVALIIRGSTLVSAFTLGPLFSALLVRKMKL